MPVSAHDIADEIRRRQPSIGIVKLHKLLYYVQGWHLAFTGKAAFSEDVEAWINGPVVADLWKDEKHGRGRPQPRDLDGDALSTIDYVLARYGRSTGKDLIRQTHNEDPWRNVSESDDPNVFIDPSIRHDALTQWFQSDDDFLDRAAAVKRHNDRTDVYSFGPPRFDVGIEDVIEAARTKQFRQPRPA